MKSMMNKKNYQSMTTDELFLAMEGAAISAHEVYITGEPIEKQHLWIDVLTAVQEEIRARGYAAESRYIPLLAAPHPAVRLSAALAARKFAPDSAVPVLQDLSHGKYGTDIATNAGMTLDGMRKRGLIPLKSES